MRTFELTSPQTSLLGTAVAHSQEELLCLLGGSKAGLRFDWKIERVAWRDNYHGRILRGRPPRPYLLIGHRSIEQT